jgi:hypothetical protein
VVWHPAAATRCSEEVGNDLTDKDV